MEGEWDNLFTAEEILGGLPMRRASSLLLVIEGRTGLLASRARHLMSPDYSGRSSEQAENVYLSALSSGANLPQEPSIQNIERFAPDWASLVPDDVSIRAALAKLIGDKYRVPRAWTPNIQRVLGTGDPELERRFQEHFNLPLSSIFVDKLTVREKLQWVRARVATWFENLPPFWTSYTLTLTETVGAGVLALPIAFAALGVIGALLLLLICGVVNMLTIAAMSEALARNGNVRFGNAYFGRLVHDYLGSAGSALLKPCLYVLSIVALFAYVLGFSATLADSVGISPMIWAAILLLVVLYFVRQESISATVTSAILVGACSIAIILLLSILSFPHLDQSFLRHNNLPFTSGNAFDASMLQLIFGVVLASLFGHTAIGNCANVVLTRDPSGRSLIRGSTAAIATAVALYMLWVFTVNGSVSPSRLDGERGTSLVPLAEVVGPSVSVLGTIFVIFSMGMGSIHQGWGLVNITREQLTQLAGRGAHRGRLSSRRFRGTLALLPVILLFLVAELLFAVDRESFSEPLGIFGLLVIPIIGGVFSMLMLAAARKKGECLVQSGWGFLGRPVVVTGISLLFSVAILVHGLVIWSEPVYRILAVAMAVVSALFIVVAWRSEIVPRSIAEVRFEEDGGPDPIVNLVAAGRPLAGRVNQLQPTRIGGGLGIERDGEGGDTALEIVMEPAAVREMKVWVHKLFGEGISRPVSAELCLNQNEAIDLGAVDGQVIVPVDGTAQYLHVRVDASDLILDSR